jgi:dolichyl-phosphate-mannose--protein O-mannosyl transferase
VQHLGHAIITAGMPRAHAAPRPSAAACWLISIVIFLGSQGLFLAGLGTPDKFVFDEVHYVPAARQMLGAVPQEPMLNPMHPPLAKQIIALSILTFGDNAWAWRFPATVFGALSLVAIYLCGLALFSAHRPAVAASLIALFNQMLFVQARIAMLDIFALGFSLLGIAAFMHGYRRAHPHVYFGLAGLAFGLSAACKWSGLFPLAAAIVIIAALRLLQGWRTGFDGGSEEDWYRPDLWPDFRLAHFALCFVLLPGAAYVSSFVALYGLSIPDILEAQRRIFADNTTTALGGHTYMSAWPSWPLLIRPVWYLFDKVGDDAIEAIVLLGNPLVLWPALVALAIALRDWIMARRADAFLVLAFYVVPYLSWALLPRTLGFLYYYLPAATIASLALVYALTRDGVPRWALWAYVALAACGLAAMLPISAAFVGTSMATFDRLMLFQSWI